MRKVLFLLLLLGLSIGNIFAEKDTLKSDFIKRLNVLSGRYGNVIKMCENKDYLAYAIVPKNSISKGGILLIVLCSNRSYDLKNGEMVPTGKGAQREITYIYDSINSDTLSINFQVQESRKEEESGMIPVDTTIDRIIKIPLRGSIKKEGTLALSYKDNYGNQWNISNVYYVSFTFVKPDRISIQVKK